MMWLEKQIEKEVKQIMVYIGVDSGKSGGIAFLYPDGIKKVFDTDTPQGLIELRKLYDEKIKCRAAIEDVYIMPGSAAKASTSFITFFGRFIGYIEFMQAPYELVRPQKWQKKVFSHLPTKIVIPKTGTDKEIRQAKYKRKQAAKKHSLAVARRMFPECMKDISREKDHNRAEALLIAEYCRRTHITEKKADHYDFLE
jgi:hypothetical protein